jgi:hypothetical protein
MLIRKASLSFIFGLHDGFSGLRSAIGRGLDQACLGYEISDTGFSAGRQGVKLIGESEASTAR